MAPDTDQAPPPKEEAPDLGRGTSEAFGGAETNHITNDSHSHVELSSDMSVSVDSAFNSTRAPMLLQDIAREVVDAYLATIPADVRVSPEVVRREVVYRTNKELRVENAMRRGTLGKDADANEKNQIPLLKQMTPSQVVTAILRFERVARIQSGGGAEDPDSNLLGIYCAEGPNEGLYVTDEPRLRGLVRSYCSPDVGRFAAVYREIRTELYDRAPKVTPSEDPNLVPVANGVIDYGTKELLPFSPEIVLLAKSSTRFVADARNPVIPRPDGSFWDVETWIASLSDDEGVPELLWEILGALLRPGAGWNRAAFFYSERGNNGKGTLAELARALVGEGRHVSLPLDEMGRDFMLEPLTRASAIITDENNVGVFIDRAANLKTIVTNDVLHINRKNRTPVSHRFRGFMVQCINEFPKFRDKSDSLYRRQLFVPFNKWFGASEDRSIKHDYVRRPAVLEYVMKRVLVDMDDYFVLSEPAACRVVADQFRAENDTVREFWEELREEFVWDLLPATFLYDVYKQWHADLHPSGKPQNFAPFRKTLATLVRDDAMWERPDAEKTTTSTRMAAPEPLIARYNLDAWRNSTYSGKDPLRIGMFDRAALSYRWCLLRVAPSAPAPGQRSATATDEHAAG